MPRLPPFQPTKRICIHLRRQLTTSSVLSANALPVTTPGPPPAPPKPSPHQYGELVQRRRRQAELLKKGQDIRSAPTAAKPGAALKKRFWKDVHVRSDDDGHHTITLDTRAVRDPSTKTPLKIPSSKPALATAIALEWDLLISAAQALKNHLIPLTSLAARANDIAAQDTGEGLAAGKASAREDIIKVLLRYLDTDTILCWAPLKSGFAEASGLERDISMAKFHSPNPHPSGKSLREVQIETATPIIQYLTTHVWPGIEIHPALEEGGSLLPRPQTQLTKDVIRGWMSGLSAWELAGLERAVLAGKSLLVASRLVVEWSERFQEQGQSGMPVPVPAQNERFSIDDAAKACSLEVAWQTGMWGEVEDTHDVEKEDLRRQFGSVVLLVTGTGTGTG